MNKRILFVLITLLSAGIASGQDDMHQISVKWGKEYKASRSTLGDIVAVTDDGFYTIKVKGKGLLGFELSLEQFGEDMNLKQSKELVLEYDKKDMELEFTTFLDQTLYVFSSFRNQKHMKKYLFVQTVDLSTLGFNDDIRMVAEVNYAGNSKRNSGSFHMNLSPDSSKVLIFCDLPYNKGEREKFSLHVLDNTLEELWSDDIRIPYDDDLFIIDQTKVSDAGDVYVLGRLFNEKLKEKRRGHVNFKYDILSYTDDGQEENEYIVDFEDKFLTDMQIAIDPDKDIICAGFYSDRGTFSIKGSYYLKIDHETKDILKTNYMEFGIDFITQTMTERQEKKAKRKAAKGKELELYEYDLDDIIMRDDGGIILIGEQYYMYVVTYTTSTGNGGTSTRTEYHYLYNDIIVISISADGKIEWTEKIPKLQHTINDGGYFSSYALAVVDDKLYFLFNDNRNNLDYRKGDKVVQAVFKGKMAVVTIVMVDSEGNQTRRALFDKANSDVIIRPKVCEQTGSHEMILYGQRGLKKHRFARVTFR